MKVIIGVFSNDLEQISKLSAVAKDVARATVLDLSQESYKAAQRFSTQATAEEISEFAKAVKTIWGDKALIKSLLESIKAAQDGVYVITGIESPEELEPIFAAKANGWDTQNWFINNVEVTTPPVFAPKMFKKPKTGRLQILGDYDRTIYCNYTDNIIEDVVAAPLMHAFQLSQQITDSPDARTSDFMSAKKVYPVAGTVKLDPRYL